MEASDVAKSLDYRQRKALRRIGRGKSVNKSMLSDDLVKLFYVGGVVDSPPTGDDLNIVSWCDWEAQVRSSLMSSRITKFGLEVLEELNMSEIVVGDRFIDEFGIQVTVTGFRDDDDDDDDDDEVIKFTREVSPDVLLTTREYLVENWSRCV